MIKSIVIGVILLPILMSGCANPPNIGNFGQPISDPQEVLAGIGQNVIWPLYQQWEEDTGDLSQSLGELCDKPSLEKIAAAQEAWTLAHQGLRRSEAFAFGPYRTLLIREKVDFRPTRPDNIESAIVNHSSFESDILDQLGNSVRGFPALEYLLFPSDGQADTLLTQLTTDPLAANRCALMTALGQDLVLNIQALVLAWSPEGGNFLGQLSHPGTDGSAFMSNNEAMAAILNQLEDLIEILKDLRLGEPLGKTSGGIALPEKVLNPYSHQSIDALLKNLEGFEAVYLGQLSGEGSPGLYDYVFGLDQYEAEEVLQRLAALRDALNAIPPPLSAAVVNVPAAVEAAYQRAMELRDLISGPLSSLVGVTPSSADSDTD